MSLFPERSRYKEGTGIKKGGVKIAEKTGRAAIGGNYRNEATVKYYPDPGRIPVLSTPFFRGRIPHIWRKDGRKMRRNQQAAEVPQLKNGLVPRHQSQGHRPALAPALCSAGLYFEYGDGIRRYRPGKIFAQSLHVLFLGHDVPGIGDAVGCFGIIGMKGYG